MIISDAYVFRAKRKVSCLEKPATPNNHFVEEIAHGRDEANKSHHC
jgi:hypothetical protein